MGTLSCPSTFTFWSANRNGLHSPQHSRQSNNRLHDDESRRASTSGRDGITTNVGTPQKRIEKLKYIHRNAVHRGLVERPEDWRWSSYRYYATEEVGTVQIESPISAWKRRQAVNQTVLVLPQE